MSKLDPTRKDVALDTTGVPMFMHDMRSEGWVLQEEGPGHPRNTPIEGLEFAFLLGSTEISIGGEEVHERVKRLKSCLGQHTAEYLLEHQHKIPKSVQGNSLVFGGTVWLNKEEKIVLPYLYFTAGKWVINFDSHRFHYSDLIVRMIR